MFVLQFLAAILDFGGQIKIIKIMYSSLFVYLYKNKHFDILHDFVSQLQAQLCLFHGFWRPFWNFEDILKFLKLHIIVKLDTYLSNEHFDLNITRLCKSIISPVMFVLRFLAAIFVFWPPF